MNAINPIFAIALAGFIPPAIAQESHQQPTADQAVSAAGVGTGVGPAVYVAGTAVAGTLIGLCVSHVICRGGGDGTSAGTGTAAATTGTTGTTK